MCIQTDQFWLLMVEQKWDKDYTLKWCRSVTILTVNQITSTNRVVSVTNLLIQFWLYLATEQVSLGELWLIRKTGETESESVHGWRGSFRLPYQSPFVPVTKSMAQVLVR